MIEDQTENPRHRLTEAVTYTNLVEVSINDFIFTTKNLSLPHLTHFSRAMLHGVIYICSPPNFTKHQGQDSFSKINLSQGEGTW